MKRVVVVGIVDPPPGTVVARAAGGPRGPSGYRQLDYARNAPGRQGSGDLGAVPPSRASFSFPLSGRKRRDRPGRCAQAVSSRFCATEGPPRVGRSLGRPACLPGASLHLCEPRLVLVEAGIGPRPRYHGGMLCAMTLIVAFKVDIKPLALTRELSSCRQRTSCTNAYHHRTACSSIHRTGRV